jgi:hypothetical protein
MDVINSIRLVIAESFPNVPIYVNNRGEGFARPSFYINYVNSDTKNMSKLVFNNLFTIQIVYFAPLDDYKNVDSINQWQTWDTLKSSFDIGFFNVGTNVAKIINLSGAPRGNEIYLNVNLQITAQRVDFNNDMSTGIPLMENIKITENIQ